MIEKNSEKPPPSRHIPPAVPNANMRVVGLNMLVMVAYTVAFRFVDSGYIFDALIMFVHLITCISLAAIEHKKSWALSGLLVLLIGFSTCYGVWSIH
ncbi:MAG: hypothetical protein ACHQF4_11505 [Sphingobacteriales bacterium]